MSDALVIEAVRKTITVDCAVEEAFRIFTGEAISWWPLAGHSINGEAVQESYDTGWDHVLGSYERYAAAA